MRFAVLVVLTSALLPAQAPKADPWGSVRFLEGEWRGSAQGQPGSGLVHRAYRFLLGGRFLQERNVSAYAPTQAGKPGELHEHWSVLSFDRRRKRLVLRQFHQEGFVNQYALDEAASTAKRLVFVSEALENLDPRWRARETYDLETPDAFIETFEIAAPGKDFELYSRSVLRRVRAE